MDSLVGNPHNREIIKDDPRVIAVLEGLRDFVDHNGSDDGAVSTIKFDGVEFGYKLEDHGVFMRRRVFIKIPGYALEDVSEEERSVILASIMAVFIVPGNRPPVVSRIAQDCLYVQQDFVPAILVERSPGLVSIVGGFGGVNNA